MKKWLSILLLAALLLTGCGNGGTVSPSGEAEKPAKAAARKLPKFEPLDWSTVKEAPAEDFAYEQKEFLEGDDWIPVVKLLTYEGDSAIVKVPEMIDGMPVVYADDGVFQGNTRITHVYLPDRLWLETQNKLFFQDCTSLVQARISVNAMSRGLFYNCTALRSVTLEAGEHQNQYVAEAAFYHCSSLTEISCHENFYAVAPNAFEGCTQLRSAQLPGVTSISSEAFKDCANLTDLLVNVNNTQFVESALDGCYALRDITLVSNFRDSNGGSISVENGVLYRVFDDDSWLIKVLAGNKSDDLQLRDDLEQIDSRAFSLCSIRHFEVPATVESLCFQTFSDCETLESVTLAPGTALKSVHYEAFDNCPALKSVDFSNDEGRGGYEFYFENSPQVKDVKYPG